jgi:hypothetical protein
MRKGWKVENFSYIQALDSSKGLFNIFRDHIQPKFAPSQSADPSESREKYAGTGLWIPRICWRESSKTRRFTRMSYACVSKMVLMASDIEAATILIESIQVLSH